MIKKISAYFGSVRSAVCAALYGYLLFFSVALGVYLDNAGPTTHNTAFLLLYPLLPGMLTALGWPCVCKKLKYMMGGYQQPCLQIG